MNIYKFGNDDYELYDPRKYPPKPPCCPCCPPKPPKPCPNHDNTLIQKQCQGDTSQSQGNQAQSQGDLTETQGDSMQSQGDQSQTLGDLSETQGDSMQSQGDQSQTLGDLSETQGDSMQSQGDQSQTLGDQMQTQGDQSQGDLMQTQGDQSQGDLMQSITGHGDQSQGEQTLTSTPTISTPVNVSGVNVNVNVCCDGYGSKKNCDEKCRETITSLLKIISAFYSSVTLPADSQINFYSSGLDTSPTTGNLISPLTECLFSLTTADDGTEITLTTISLELLSVASSDGTPQLFELLLNYSTDNAPCSQTNCGYCYENSYCCEKTCCDDEIRSSLSGFIPTNAELDIRTENNSVTAFAYSIKCNILYLVDDTEDPQLLYAVPLCKITGYNAV